MYFSFFFPCRCFLPANCSFGCFFSRHDERRFSRVCFARVSRCPLQVTYTYASPRDTASLSALRGSAVQVDFASWSSSRISSALSSRFPGGYPACVVNCAAVSVPGDCERDPARAAALNVPRGVLRWIRDVVAARRRSAGLSGVFHSSVPSSLALPVFIHLSTDQVYGGERPWWREGDVPEPRNVYAATKVKAEALVALASAGGEAGERLEQTAIDDEFGTEVGEERGAVVGEELGEVALTIDRNNVSAGENARAASACPLTFRFPCVRGAILRCSIVAGPLPPIPVSRRLPIHALVATLRAGYAHQSETQGDALHGPASRVGGDAIQEPASQAGSIVTSSVAQPPSSGALPAASIPSFFGDEFRCPVSVHDVARACLSIVQRADELFAQTTDPSDPDLLFASPPHERTRKYEAEEDEDQDEGEEERTVRERALKRGVAKRPDKSAGLSDDALEKTNALATSATSNSFQTSPAPLSSTLSLPGDAQTPSSLSSRFRPRPLKSALRQPSSPPFPFSSPPSSPRSLPPPCLVFNVGGPERLSRADMAGIVAAALGLPPLPAAWIVPRASVLGTQGAARSPADISMRVLKMRDALGIHPATFGEVVREVIARGEV